MPLLQNLNLKAKPILKTAGLAILVIIVIYIAFSLIGSLFGSFSGRSQSIGYSKNASYDSGVSMSAPMMASRSIGLPDLSLSSRNAESEMMVSEDSSYLQDNAPSSGSQAEKFEVAEYDATIKTRQLESACATVSGLKVREDVIFESAREYSYGCNYTFKVTREKTDEILALLKGMKPRELAGNTYTIQSQVNDYTSEIDILQKKLASIDETLGKAIISYDEVAQVATGARDVTNLARAIDSKISTIERLAQQRININSQLDMIQSSKSQQLDRLGYTYFSVNITKDSIINWQNLNDSWGVAIRESTGQVNEAIQNISVNLVGFLFNLLQYIIYALILLLVAKYGWRLTKSIWQN